MKELSPDEDVLDAVRQMQKLMTNLSTNKDSISRATSFAVMHAKQGGAHLMTEVIADRLEEVLSPPLPFSGNQFNYSRFKTPRP